ncbi:MAG: hypothetical protein K2Q09_05995 [Phycisphaerales bacterium]|nr:hypothetical protein [Phycisphaerales bacterium]
MATTTAKICSICHSDCSTRPRVKDELGRYACRTCFDTAPAAPQAPPPDDALDLRAAAMIEARSQAAELPVAHSCPRCEGYLAADQRLCLRCGYDRKRGAKVLTRVETVKEVKSDWLDQKRQRQKTDRTVGIAVWSACIALLAGYFIGFYVPVLFMVTAPMLAMVSVGTTITLIVFAFIDTERSAAVCGLAYLPILVVCLAAAPAIGPIPVLAGMLISFLAWARLMHYGATQGRMWLRALSNTVVAQILLLILTGILLAFGVLPMPEWVQDAINNARQNQSARP